MCVETMQTTRTFSGDAYHLLHVKYEDKAGHRVWFRSRLNRERMYDFVARPLLRVPSYAGTAQSTCTAGRQRILAALRVLAPFRVSNSRVHGASTSVEVARPFAFSPMLGPRVT